MFDKPEEKNDKQALPKIQADELPLVETPKKLDYQELLNNVLEETNEDPVSTEYRQLKQIIERLNRTFKGNYNAAYGFGSKRELYELYPM